MSEPEWDNIDQDKAVLQKLDVFDLILIRQAVKMAAKNAMKNDVKRGYEELFAKLKRQTA